MQVGLKRHWHLVPALNIAVSDAAARGSHRLQFIFMNADDFYQALSAWSAFATAMLTLALVAMAVAAWQTAKQTLESGRQANEAQLRAAEAAERANRQMEEDGRAQARPYVDCRLVPGLAGQRTYDMVLRNYGKTSAVRLVFEFDPVPDRPEDTVRDALLKFAVTPRELGPGSHVRFLWQAPASADSEPPHELGLPVDTVVKLRYQDRVGAVYEETTQLWADGLWPMPHVGPNADRLTGDAAVIVKTLKAVASNIGELRR